MTLLQTRTHYGLTQKEVAATLNIPVRTYIRYETDDNYGNALKRQMMVQTLQQKFEITETKGLISLNFIRETLAELFETKYKSQVDLCYLFGSYSKGYATETSDVDLCVSTSLTGFAFVGLSEDIRNALHKKVDLIRLNQLTDNQNLLFEIMKDGIKVYGWWKLPSDVAFAILRTWFAFLPLSR